MANLVKPGPTGLNMHDVAENLETVYRHVTKVKQSGRKNDTDATVVNWREGGTLEKPVLKEYRDKIVKADDTDLVHNVPAEYVAIAGNLDPGVARDKHGISTDDFNARTTVRNAKLLDSKPLNYFMTQESGTSLAGKTENILKYYGKDIASLRDELYQLKNALEKNGLITLSNEHFGYNDIFRNGYYPYEYKELGKPTQKSDDPTVLILDENATKDLDAGDYIAVYFHHEQKVNVVQIKSISSNGEKLYLDEGLSYDTAADNITVYKSYGVSRNGNFYFARDVEYQVGEESIHTGLDDDTATTLYHPVSKEQSSYAYSFRIPESKRGFLSKFRICANAIGTPTLTCYIFDEEDIGNFKNPEQAEALYKAGDTNTDGEPKMHFFAKSRPVVLDPDRSGSEGYIVNFDFWDDATDTYPLLTRKDTPHHRVRYVAVICGTYVDDSNYAKIKFLVTADEKKTEKDLQINNRVYRYTRQDDSAKASALTAYAEDNHKDMYYEVLIREAIENSMDPQLRGLYTAVMRAPKNMPVSRARMTLKIKREGGLWDSTLTEAKAIGNGVTSQFPVEVYQNFPDKKGSFRSASFMGLSDQIRTPIELRADTTNKDARPEHQVLTAIGNDIVTADANGLDIVPKDTILARPNDRVYRIGYTISVKGKRYEYDAAAKGYKVKDTKKIYLNPIAIVPDDYKEKTDPYSDRIIWEGDFRDKDGNPQWFNELEFQIVWQKPAFNENSVVKQEQMGIIRDLVFSTDRAV